VLAAPLMWLQVNSPNEELVRPFEQRSPIVLVAALLIWITALLASYIPHAGRRRSTPWWPCEMSRLDVLHPEVRQRKLKFRSPAEKDSTLTHLQETVRGTVTSAGPIRQADSAELGQAELASDFCFRNFPNELDSHACQSFGSFLRLVPDVLIANVV
jgi:hypothetical protein